MIEYSQPFSTGKGSWWYADASDHSKHLVGPFPTRAAARHCRSLDAAAELAADDDQQSEVVLVFSAPVYVVVTRSGGEHRISKVVVDDENTDFTKSSSANDGIGNDLPLDDRDVAAAADFICDSCTDWPAWEFGW